MLSQKGRKISFKEKKELHDHLELTFALWFRSGVYMLSPGISGDETLRLWVSGSTPAPALDASVSLSLSVCLSAFGKHFHTPVLGLSSDALSHVCTQPDLFQSLHFSFSWLNFFLNKPILK